MTYYIKVSNVPEDLATIIFPEIKSRLEGYIGCIEGYCSALFYTENKKLFNEATKFLEFIGVQYTTFEW